MTAGNIRCRQHWSRARLPLPDGLPSYLELYLLDTAFAFVLDTHYGLARHDDAPARHLDGKAFAAFQGGGQPAQLGDKRLA